MNIKILKRTSFVCFLFLLFPFVGHTKTTCIKEDPTTKVLTPRFCYDKRMLKAADIALEKAHPRSTRRCWRAVKDALMAADVLTTRPSSKYAKVAGDELEFKYGFTKLSVENPFLAPVGAVLVYGGKGPGHVEIRTKKGFVSDYPSKHPSRRPLIGVYVKKVDDSAEKV